MQGKHNGCKHVWDLATGETRIPMLNTLYLSKRGGERGGMWPQQGYTEYLEKRDGRGGNIVGGTRYRKQRHSEYFVNGQNGWQSGILRDEVGKGGILAKSGDCG